MSSDAVRAPAVTTGPDEVSLRDLFLVVRKWSVVILLVALVAGIAVVVFLRSRPPAYESTATVSVARSPLGVEVASNLVFQPEVEISFETYQALALGQTVLNWTLMAVPQVDLDVEGLRSAVRLERLVGAANQSSSLLLVDHVVRTDDAGLSATLATAWAEATLKAVRSIVMENLEGLRRFGDDRLALADAQRQAAEQALRDYRVRADALSDPQQSDQLRRQLDMLSDQLALVRMLLPARQAELESLRTRLTEDPEALVVLSDAPEVSVTVQGGVWSLEARVAALAVEEASLTAELETVRDAAVVLATRVVDHQRELTTLSLEADEAMTQVTSLTAVADATEYLMALAGESTRLMSEAEEARRPVAQPVMVYGMLTVLAVALAGVVLALLAEAVRAPDEEAAATGSGVPPPASPAAGD